MLIKRVFLCLLILISATCLFGSAFANNDAKFLIYPYIKHVDETTAIIIWEMNKATDGTVYYGSNKGDYDKSLYSKTSNIHYVTIDGLKPNSIYYYRVESGKSSTPVNDTSYSFKTALKDTGTFEFAVFGDTDSGVRGSDIDHKRVVQSVNDFSNPEFIILSGDLVNNSSSKKDWVRFFHVENELIKRVPIYPVMGNNDMNGEEYFKRYFSYQHDMPWYSFTYGNCKFIGLNILRGKGDNYYQSLRPGNPQFMWLLEELQSESNLNADFTFVYFHAPVFAPDNTQNKLLEEMIHPLFVKYGVDIVFNGTHSFTWAEKDGIQYLVSGGGGAEIIPVGINAGGGRIKEADFFLHHLRIRVNYPIVNVNVIDTNGSVFRSFNYWDPDAKTSTGRKTYEPVDVKIKKPGKNEIPLELYSVPNCDVCERLMNKTIPQISVNTSINLPTTFYSLNKAENFERFVKIETKLGNTNNDLPALLIGNTILGGEEEITKNLKSMVLSYSNGEKEWDLIDVDYQMNPIDLSDTILERFASFTLFVIVVAGVLDGINPCAFTSIVFLLSYLLYLGKRKREILIAGSSFCLGILLTYVLLGAGLSQILEAIEGFKYIAVGIKYLMFLFVAVLAIFSLYDFVCALQGRLKDIKLQLPEFLKKKIHERVRKGTRNSRLFISSVVLGFFITIIEFACTGQIYLPTITYMIQSSQEKVLSYLYLVVYNLAHIAPLVIIFTLAYFGLTAETLGKFYKKHIPLIKLMTAFLFIALSVLILLF